MIPTLLIAAAAGLLQPVFADKPCDDARLATIARCGTVEVPENRAEPEGRRIPLNVIVLKATGSAPHLPPLFDLEGGPGLAVSRNLGFYLQDGAAYRERRDVVLIDQRGTGGSNGLSCPELEAPEAAYAPLFPADAVARCRRTLEAKADLTRYLTQDAVADLDAVRVALGYTEIDLQGLSYGTTVALRYLATYPDRVRAAVLLGVAPPSLMPPARHAIAAERALGLLFAECSADGDCGTAFRPEADLALALSKLPSGRDGLTPELFLEKIRALLYQPVTARQIPWIVSRAASGDLAPFYALTKPRGPSPYFEGMFLSVTCSEALGLMDYELSAAQSRSTHFGDYRLRRQRDACGAWIAGTVEASFLAPVKTGAAVLLVSGGLDPVTPPELAEALSGTLPHARHLVIPASGHVFDGLSGIDTCFDPLVVKFLDTSDLNAVDPTCLETMRPPPFKTSEDHVTVGP